LLGSTVSLPQTEDPGVYFESELRIPEGIFYLQHISI